MQIKISILSVIFFSFLLSCKNETEKIFVNVEVEKQKAWQQHPDLAYDQKYILDAYIDEEKNQYVCFGGKYFHVIDSLNKLKTSFSFYNVNNNEKKIISNKDFQLTIPKNEYNPNQDVIEIYPKLEFSIANRLRVELKEKDSDFKGIRNYDISWNIQTGAIHKNQILLPVLTSSNQATFYLIEIDTTIIGYAREKSFKKIVINNQYADFGGSIVYSFYNKFFVSQIDAGGEDLSYCYIIYPNGNVKKINSATYFKPWRMFILNNKLFAISDRYIYTSMDEGETWTLKYTANSNLNNYTYQVINNQLIAISTNSSKISHIIFNETGFESKEILNEGLEGNQITSMLLLNKKVYVSTLSGLFTREYNSFFTYKN